ncbi:DUF5331 domain-containing protein [Anabaena lutea]|uniref:DUF5331 domain-containing protein n=1 Tax=Anabaena lutea FACHB-196 TaxID=2692881 RepID=A0ABR8FNM5_9NOST|nr:DUF5331 domain-containing protein [Anabaena lutea]MBD2571365.1 hypothetical protein [Anabaena lutea FACHB-196]
MDIQQLRQSLKMKWLSYCKENRLWLVKIRIWHSYNGVRRPSSGYILATLSILEPELKKILPFLLELNNNPDQIVAALGLNFNPEEELRLLKSQHYLAKNQVVSKPPAKSQVANTSIQKEHKQVLLRITTNVDKKPESVAVGAVTTSANHHSPTTALSEMGREQTQTRTDKRSLSITTTVPHQTKAVPSLSRVNKPNHNPQFMSIPVKQVSHTSPTTNARSLPSWIDEFCQGVKWEQDETITRKL